MGGSGSGRKPLPEGERKKFRNVSLDTDLIDLLNEQRDKAEPLWGFRPTLSQMIRHLLREKLGRLEAWKKT